MRKLIGVSPAVLLVLTACGSRGTHDDDPVIVTPDPACESDEDCGDGAICFEGTCAQIAATEAPDTTPPETTAPETTSAATIPTGTTTSLPDPDDAPPSNLSGVWIGYLEGSQFASGSDI